MEFPETWELTTLNIPSGILERNPNLIFHRSNRATPRSVSSISLSLPFLCFLTMTWWVLVFVRFNEVGAPKGKVLRQRDGAACAGVVDGFYGRFLAVSVSSNVPSVLIQIVIFFSFDYLNSSRTTWTGSI